MTSLLYFDGVALRRGGRLLFEDLDLELRAGEALQVAGSNGSGKSSLIRLAGGLLRQERGSNERNWRSPMTRPRSIENSPSERHWVFGAERWTRRWRRSGSTILQKFRCACFRRGN